MKNFKENMKILNDYLDNFHPNKRIEILKLFENFDHERYSEKTFNEKMKLIIGMPKIGKQTRNYWIARGWSEKEADEKRVKIEKSPDTSPFNVNYWLNKGYSKKDAEFKVKSQRKLNIEYWLNKGYSDEDAIIEVSRYQKDNSKKMTDKYLNDVEFRNEMSFKLNTNINYWLNKGYSENEAKKKLSKRQATFSKETCIEKYGKKEGLKKWKERQDKWQNSLKESDYNLRDGKDCKSIEFYKNKFGAKWFDEYLKLYDNIEEMRKILSYKNYKEMLDSIINEKLSYVNRIISYQLVKEYYNVSHEELIKYIEENYIEKIGPEYWNVFKNEDGNWLENYLISHNILLLEEVKFLLSFNNYKKMIDYMINEYSLVYIRQHINRSITQYIYKCTYDDMDKYIMKIDPTIKSKYGRFRYFNNHLCKSDSEYLISKFLFDNNIEYEYEKEYVGKNWTYDFYLVDKNIYIEFTGMYFLEKSKIRYEEKKTYCKNNNINCIFSHDINYVINKIKDIYEIKNNTQTT